MAIKKNYVKNEDSLIQLGQSESFEFISMGEVHRMELQIPGNTQLIHVYLDEM